MTESEAFWLSVLEQLDQGELTQKFDVPGIGGETPLWVTRLAAELFTMLVPRVQLRIGQRATAERVGVLVGMQLILFDILSALADGESERAERFNLMLKKAKSFLGGFDAVAAVDERAEHKKAFEAAFGEVLPAILSRPNDERYEFFHAVARIIRPEKSRKAMSTGALERRLKTIAVYGVTLMHWRKIDRLQTSRQGYEFLRGILPVEVVGHDRERIRRMFDRLGKKFGPPGRPRKRSSRTTPR